MILILMGIHQLKESVLMVDGHWVKCSSWRAGLHELGALRDAEHMGA